MKEKNNKWVAMNDRLPRPEKPVIVTYHFRVTNRARKAVASGYFINGCFQFHDSHRLPHHDCLLISWKYAHKGAIRTMK